MNSFARVATLLLGLVLSTALWAHAMLDRAVPRVGGIVKVAPARVELWFTEPLEPAFSTLRVVDAHAHQVDGRDVSVDPGDRRHLSVSVAPLAPGQYRVIWRAVSLDAHATEGDFRFSVSP